MDKLILSIYERKQHPTIKSVFLLQKDEKISTPLLRKKLYDLDLSNKLVLCLDSELSKIFKTDYDFKDHGIYHPVYLSPNYSQECFAWHKEITKTKTKIKNWGEKGKDTTILESLVKTQEEELNALQKQIYFILIPLEDATMDRDYQRFCTYDTFVDPVRSCLVTTESIKSTVVFLDIETTGLDFEKEDITHIGVKGLGESFCNILHFPKKDTLLLLLKSLEGKTVVLHNAVFDLSWLLFKTGLEFIPNFETVDTMLLAHVAGEYSLSLKHLSMMHGNFLGRRNTLSADDDYLVEDLLATECLYNKFKPALDTFAGKLVCNAVKAFTEIRVAGVYLDEKRLFEIRDSYTYLDTPKYNFNVDSNRELAKYFISQGVPLSIKTATDDYKVDIKTLETIKHPAVEEYLEYQKELGIYQKFLKPYCEMRNFTLRPNINLAGTKTGRLSADNPNVQQIPNRSLFKDIFSSRFKDDGFIASVDLDQAELRVAALLSNDKVYAKALLSSDFHRLVASKTFEKPENEVTKQERFTAKSVNFGGVLYGGSAAGIAFRIHVATDLVAKVQEWYKKEFTILTNWIESTKELSVRTSQVRTLFGRLRILKDLRYDQKKRIGVNTAVQSVASDILLYILVRLSSLLRKHQLKSKILFPVHDELVLDIYKPELEQIIALLDQSFKDVLKTPLGNLELAKTLPVSGTLEWGKSWLYLKSEKYHPEGNRKVSSI